MGWASTAADMMSRAHCALAMHAVCPAPHVCVVRFTCTDAMHAAGQMVAKTLVRKGFAVHALDHQADLQLHMHCAKCEMSWQGHGRSEGDRCHVERFQHFVDDVSHLL